MEANNLKELIFKRTGLKPNELVCPREKSAMTPCVARDGDLDMTEKNKCAGCGSDITRLLQEEIAKK